MSIETRSEPPVFSTEPIETYRPMSTMAVVSIVLAVLSLGAFATIKMLVVTAFALVLSIVTSIRLERAKSEYAGQLLARLAAVLAVVSLFGSVTKYGVEWAILTREAHRVADQFLDEVLAFQVKRAFYWRMPPWGRPADEDAKGLDELLIRNGPAYRDFVNSPLVAKLGGKVADAQVTYAGVETYGYDTLYHVSLQYVVNLDGADYLVHLWLQGTANLSPEEKSRRWFIHQMAIEPKTAG